MLADLKFAFRSLAKSPGFSVVALLTLTLGIGVNTTMFTVVNTMLFQQLAYPGSDRLVRIFRTSPQSQRWPHAAANYLDTRAQARSFTAMAAYNQSSANYAEPGQPAERLRGMDVTGDFFALLGLQPEIGRSITAAETSPGAAPVVVLSHACWTRRFQADPGIIGRQLRIDGNLSTVIGVMPSEFTSPTFWGQIELWRPLVFTAKDEQNRENNYMSIVGRLAPGVTLEQAAAELDGIAARLERDHPLTNAKNGLRAVPLAIANQAESGRQMTWVVMGLAGFVLLIACSNLANLQFARTASRTREYGIRLALGAPRWRIMRELLVESLLLALLGAGLGLLAALWGNDLLASRLATETPGLKLALDWRVFTFALVAAVLSGVALGLLPAWFASRSDINQALKQQSRGSTADRTHHRVRNSLIIAEVALALVLLAGAGVFIRGLQRFALHDPGWRPDGMVSGYVSLPLGRYGEDAARNVFFEKLAAGLAANPRFTHAALSSSLPTQGYNSSTSLVAEDKPQPPRGQEPLMNIVFVSPTYFETVGVRLLQGRNFTADDRSGAPRVAIINESLARALWPGENPIGRRLGDADPVKPDWRIIVGVVNDVTFPGQLNPPDTRFQLYAPLLQDSWNFFAIAARGHGAPDELERELRQAVAAVDPDQPVHGFSSVRADIDRSLGNFRLIGGLFGGFAALGLALASLGIYGVLAGFVAQRRAEIGVRMALGAQVGHVLRLVLGRGLRLAVIGAAAGLLGAFVLVRLLGRILPELGAPDPLTIGAVVVALLGVAFLACWLPARRATKVDPMVALRAE
ncbi:MAG TPA: ABC transporter permease [Lacunisphaera sp.]|nr:ABC transporter permease [Lacunisphaera sp.]